MSQRQRSSNEAAASASGCVGTIPFTDCVHPETIVKSCSYMSRFSHGKSAGGSFVNRSLRIDFGVRMLVSVVVDRVLSRGAVYR
jgi:hypothetical protein